MVKWEANWRREYPNAPAGRPNNFDLLAYGDMYVVAEGLKRTGKELTTDKFIAALEGVQNYRVGPVATPRTFSTKHHIGNLTLVPMIVAKGVWEPVGGWQSTRESDILKRY
jgi:branched-chain amino acid transport system substrate-binding protein